MIPAFIITRDRITPLLRLLKWLDGKADITLVDNQSNYPPMVEFLNTTKYKVARMEENYAQEAPWKSGLVGSNREEFFIVSDPDVVPDENCPDDAIDFLIRGLERNPGERKAGLSLRIDNLPDHYPLKESTIAWESQFWKNSLDEDFYLAPVDTTFAVYRLGTPHTTETGIRSKPPYQALHLPWYSGPTLTEEEEYYKNRASQGTSHSFQW